MTNQKRINGLLSSLALSFCCLLLFIQPASAQMRTVTLPLRETTVRQAANIDASPKQTVGVQKPDGVSGAISDTVRQATLLFRFDSSEIDSGFMENAENMGVLHTIMTDIDMISRLDSIVIIGSASPDGSPARNRHLALQRANAIKSYILQNYPLVDKSLISVRTKDGFLEELINVVLEDPDVPGRSQLLHILGNPYMTEMAKNVRMRQINNGETFAYLRDNYILRRLRTGTILQLSYKYPAPEQQLQPQPQPQPQQQLQPQPQQQLQPQSESDSAYVAADTPAQQQVPPTPTPIPTPMPVPTTPTVQRITTYPIALRSNLLLLLVGGPNLGIEIPMGRRFSIAGDFAYAHTRINNHYTLQLMQGTLEVRHWFKPRRNPLSGWNLGVYGTYSDRFDFQIKEGWQGDRYWSVGLSGGYSVALSRRFNLDFSILGGYFYSPEIRYYSRPQDGHLLWEETRYNVSRLTLTQIRLNLTWLIGKNREVSK